MSDMGAGTELRRRAPGRRWTGEAELGGGHRLSRGEKQQRKASAGENPAEPGSSERGLLPHAERPRKVKNRGVGSNLRDTGS